MIIKNITSLNNFGIFKNNSNSEEKYFGKYNLFYGLNEVGKPPYWKSSVALRKEPLRKNPPLLIFLYASKIPQQ